MASVEMNEILSEVCRLLAERAGLSSEALGASAIAHAMRKRSLASGAASPQDYLRRLAADAAEFQELLEELVVPETWFFRDALAFGSLALRLAAARARNAATIRVLSAGCSTGEEAYSLAMVLREAGFAPAQTSILATDVTQRALDFARRGTYTSRSFRDSDDSLAAIRNRWFEPLGDSWQVRDELRGGVEFRQENLRKSASSPANHRLT